MKTLITKAIVLIGIVLTLNVKAQEQYRDLVITQKGDSIRCNINLFPAVGAIKYKSAAMISPEKIEPGKIKEYFTSGFKVNVRAVYIDSSKKPVYMMFVEKGKINLFERADGCSICAGGTETTVSNDNWYIAKGSDHVTAFKSAGITFDKQKRKKIFAQMLKDNSIVYNKYLAGDKFGFSDLRNFVHLYNTGEPLKN
ncbi:MAG TPA: hypothetical protein VGN20_22785 [Mucilaginibacter sp.]|jgi:hypothetical protein